MMSYSHNGTLASEDIGWAHQFAMVYLTYLCGVDCHLRCLQGLCTVEQIERQAKSNLMHSVAVVGIMEDGEDLFLEMINSRVQYINTALNPDVKGRNHGTSTSSTAKICKELFKNPDHRQKLIDGSPAIAAISRVYETAKEVNAFQKRELEACTRR
eukprot:CAMPEP_0117734488 /NCGR_PEP_ID=MMETSP0947-20121206/704_1 /TAXON_ID=44440 /ORGANISM="Chattonella subsalsa, Strain CCMP2191" /LENGTH=155 /DNA_ID=CAMNT_0005549277 /DNA_START=887 /DNA_END=1354 /DNA_ORIENTATION=+